MPIYDYHCSHCDKTEERIVKTADVTVSCPTCGRVMDRQIGLSSFRLKGPGWFAPDNRKQS